MCFSPQNIRFEINFFFVFGTRCSGVVQKVAHIAPVQTPQTGTACSGRTGIRCSGFGGTCCSGLCILNIYKNISNFIHESYWKIGYTKNGNAYIGTTYKHHIIRIYGKDKKYAFQIALKVKGEKWHNWNDIIYTKNKNLNEVKELAYIVAKGITTDKKSEKEILRNIYKRIK